MTSTPEAIKSIPVSLWRARPSTCSCRGTQIKTGAVFLVCSGCGCKGPWCGYQCFVDHIIRLCEPHLKQDDKVIDDDAVHWLKYAASVMGYCYRVYDIPQDAIAKDESTTSDGVAHWLRYSNIKGPWDVAIPADD